MTGQAFPPGMGKIIGTLDVDGNLALVGDQPRETPEGARTCASDSTRDNQPQKSSDPQGI